MPKQSAPESPQPEASQPGEPTQPTATDSGSTRPPSAPHTHRFFAWIRSLGLVRSPGWIGGVSAGIADRIGIDVLVVRGILVVVAVLGGPAVLLYALAWLVLPDRTGRIHLEDLVRGRVETPVVGIALLVALSLLPVAQGFWWFGSLYWGAPQWGGSLGRAVWTLVILGLVTWLVVWFARGRGRTPAASASAAATGGQPDAATAPPATGAVAFVADEHTGFDGVAPAGVASAGLVADEVAAGEPAPPVAPPVDASADEVAAWRVSQEKWKADHDAYRRQQLDERRAAARAASEAAQAERSARAALHRERERLTRSHPLYSAALIGVALIAGAVATLVLGGGAPEPVDWLIGAAIAVGVLGVGIIVNGALGRRSGGASGVAVLLAIVLLIAGLFPQTQTLTYFGNRVVSPTQHGTNSSTTYLQGFGNIRVDLESYYPSARPKAAAKNALLSYDQVDIVVLSGNVTVELPADEYQYIAGATAAGHITTSDGTIVQGQYGKQVNLPGDPHGDRAARELDVDIHVLHGNITFIEEETK